MFGLDTLKRRLGLALFAIFVVIAAPATARITPQDQDLLLPPAIGPADLAKYLDRLGADDEQRRLAHISYAAYQSDYGPTKSEYKERLATLAATIDRAPFPPPGTASEFLQVRQLAMQRLSELDERLVGAVEASLTPDQFRAVSFVRLARERVFYDCKFLNRYPEMEVDLTELVGQLKLGKNEYAAIQRAIEEYQLQMALVIRRRHDAAIGFCMRVLEGLKRAGIDDSLAADPKNFRELMQQLDAQFTANERALVEASNSVARTNRQSVAVLGSLLPNAAADSLGQNYNLVSFPTIYGRVDPVQSSLSVVPLEWLSDRDRMAVAQIRDQYRQARQETMNQMVRELTAYQEKNLSFLGIPRSEEAAAMHEATTARLDNRLAELEATTLAALAELIPTERAVDQDAR